MNRIIWIFCSACLLFNSCQSKQKPGKNVSPVAVKMQLIDYKSDLYRLSIGESYKLSNKKVDWSWAAMADNDNRLDSAGKDAFLSLGEPLLQYNGGEYLPSLHIETDHNIITKFTCSILFELDGTSTALENFLKILSNDIPVKQAEYR